MRVCVVLNPTARGNQARRFRRRLDALASECVLKPTTGPEAAVRLAADAVREGFETVVAAGGDGTVNEVLNGIATTAGGLEQTRLGILPLGTINVFAKELGLPVDFDRAWNVIQAGRETRVDLPWAEFVAEGQVRRRCFAQLAGAGLDSRAISLVDWHWKTKVGPLAYVVAGLQAMRGRQPVVTVTMPDGRRASGELVLIGNGVLYGGWVAMFPGASLRDGQLNIRVLPRVGASTLAKFGLSWVFRRGLTVSGETRFCADRFAVTSEPVIPFELDGDNAGPLPVTFSVQRTALRVIVG